MLSGEGIWRWVSRLPRFTACLRWAGLKWEYLVGVVTATGFSAYAQLVPWNAPLEQQLQGQQAEHWLRLNRDLEAAERSLYRSPLVPCR